jgi:hypothetical protein
MMETCSMMKMMQGMQLGQKEDAPKPPPCVPESEKTK